MRKILLLAVIGAIGWAAYPRSHVPEPVASSASSASSIAPPSADEPTPLYSPSGTAAPRAQPSFSCDGRQYCSQMTSCAEATYFLEHCPDVKMDGDHDGIPCEDQWCGHG